MTPEEKIRAKLEALANGYYHTRSPSPEEARALLAALDVAAAARDLGAYDAETALPGLVALSELASVPGKSGDRFNPGLESLQLCLIDYRMALEAARV